MNKYTFLALAWFAIGVHMLIFKESSNELPPFPHFDKVAHFGLFFVQIWLAARAFIQSNKYVPYLGLTIFALIYALGSEWGQSHFTETRECSWLDVFADICGATLALVLIKISRK